MSGMVVVELEVTEVEGGVVVVDFKGAAVTVVYVVLDDDGDNELSLRSEEDWAYSARVPLLVFWGCETRCFFLMDDEDLRFRASLLTALSFLSLFERLEAMVFGALE